MPQGIQEEEEPTQGKVDKGLQEVSWLEEIKNIRQAHHIFQRMKMAKKIQKAKDSKEVERDLALIKSPAAGLRQAMKAKQHEEEEEGEVEMSEVDTSLNLAANKKKVKARQEAKVEEVHEDKLEELMEEAD